MATICFDIKRKNKDEVYIKHIDINHFSYNVHLPLSSFYDSVSNGKEESLICLIIAKQKDKDLDECIIWATTDIVEGINHDLEWLKKEYERNNMYMDFRCMIVPFCKDCEVIDLGKQYTLKNKNARYIRKIGRFDL